MDEHLSDI